VNEKKRKIVMGLISSSTCELNKGRKEKREEGKKKSRSQLDLRRLEAKAPRKKEKGGGNISFLLKGK